MRIQPRPKRSLLETVLLLEIVQGMALTLKRFFSPPITRQYPDEKRQPFLGFRGRHALVRDSATGDSRCVACLRCATVCPSQCIHIGYHEEEGGRRVMEHYDIEALRCIYCGYCAEVCPVGALVLTETYEYASYDRQKNFFDKGKLLANWDEFIKESGHEPNGYVNPFWRPRGADEDVLPGDLRRKVPAEWTRAGQPVGRHHQSPDAKPGAEGVQLS
jgi:NADH-quinone oxidoreductase subunit I